MIRKTILLGLMLVVFKTAAENNLIPNGSEIPFTCDSSPYLVRGDNVSDSRLETIVDISGGAINFNIIIPTVIGKSVNAIGYNVLDNFMYGSLTNNGAGNQIVRVASNGFFNLGTVSGLSSNTKYFSGTMDEAGFLYLTGSGNNATIQKIDISTNPPTLVSTLTLSSSMAIADMAFNPVDSMIYAVTESGQLKKFDLPTGTVTNVGSGGLPTDFGALYIDKNGIGYGLSNNGTRGLHRIDLTLGTSQKLATYPGSVIRNDGAFCTNQSLLLYDYGDTPTSYGTLIIDNGAGHIVPQIPSIYLGSIAPDVDIDGFADGIDNNFNASDDDNEISDDEDGVSIPVIFTENLAYSIDVEVTGNGFLNGWIDWNKDGIFDAVAELVTTTDQVVSSGSVTLSGTAPAGITQGASYARFRICSTNNNCNSPLGIANDGEVEDYQVQFGILADVGVSTILDTTAPYNSGQLVQFSFDVINNGSATATAINVAALTSNLTVQSIVASNCVPANTLPCTINSLPIGNIESFTVTAMVNAPGVFDLKASVSNFELDVNTENDESNAGGVASGTPFNCDATPYLVLGENPDSSRLDGIVDIAGGMIAFNNLIATDNNLSVNGIGYNILDNYIYGARSNGTVGTNQLIQISSNGFANIGEVTGLPVAKYHAGTMDTSGFLYLRADEATSPVQKIAINGVNASLDSTFALSIDIKIADFIYNPADGDFYTVDDQGQMYKFSLPSGNFVAIGSGGLPNLFGSFYIDVDGAVYGFDNRSSVGLHRLNLVDGTSQQLASYNNSVSRSDGTICPNASLLEFDYGDAPDSYSTLIASNGPGHIVPFAASLYLGVQVPDTDDDGFGDGIDDNLDASDDDVLAIDDEDGVSVPTSFTGNALYNIDIQVTGNGFLNAWVDWNKNGIFDSGESVANDLAVSSGVVALSAYASSVSVSGVSYARFRLCGNSGECNTPYGLANNGEVEDYQVMLVVNSDIPPVAVADSFTLTEDNPTTVLNVLSNDTDADGGTVLIQTVTQPIHGNVINAFNSLSYTPDANYCNDGMATDDFTYTLNGGSTTLVEIVVNCVDDLPITINDTVTILEDALATNIDVLNNDSDWEGDIFTIVSVSQPSNGAVVNNTTSLSYLPNADYCNNGTATDDSSYTITGGATATVSVTVNCVNDAPSYVPTCNNIDASAYAGASNNSAQFYNFSSLSLGPLNESSQTILGFTLNLSDPQGVISQATIDANGYLSIDYTLQTGVATLGISIQDDGGTALGGDDTSVEQEFFLSYSNLSTHTDRIHTSSFEYSCESVSLDIVE